MHKINYLIILLWITVLNYNVGYAQKYEMKTRVSDTLKAELMKLEEDLFPIQPEFSFNLSSSDPLRSFSQIPDQQPYNDEYYQKLKSSWESDTLDPRRMYSLGDFYSFHKQSEYAYYFFNKAYSKMDIKYFDNDSASYLSYLGLLKYNLGIENAIDDIKRSLVLNPNDSVAMAFYPVFLINNGDYKEVRKISVAALNKDSINPLFPYVCLVAGEVLGFFTEKMGEVMANEKLKDEYIKIDHDKLINFELINKYAEKYKTNIEVRNTRYMADIFALTLKLIFFISPDENEKIVFHYTPNDIKKLKSLEKIFSGKKMKKELNGYDINKSIGYINFMLQNWDKAISYYNKAISVFPESKRKDMFNTAEIYDALLSIYYIRKDDHNFRETMLRKIKAEPLGRTNVHDMMVLARHYYLMGDITNAEEFANKAKGITPEDFEILRLLSHIYYLKGSNSLNQFYGNQAYKYIKTNSEQNAIALQFAIYYLIIGDAASAYNNIGIARQSSEADNSDCELCDELINKYIRIVPE